MKKNERGIEDKDNGKKRISERKNKGRGRNGRKCRSTVPLLYPRVLALHRSGVAVAKGA